MSEFPESLALKHFWGGTVKKNTLYNQILGLTAHKKIEDHSIDNNESWYFIYLFTLKNHLSTTNYTDILEVYLFYKSFCFTAHTAALSEK